MIRGKTEPKVKSEIRVFVLDFVHVYWPFLLIYNIFAYSDI